MIFLLIPIMLFYSGLSVFIAPVQQASDLIISSLVVMLVGIWPEIAQTLVGLGISLDGIEIDATLQRGLARALAQTRGGVRATTVGG